MEQANNVYGSVQAPSQEEQQIVTQYRRQRFWESIQRFFYNIWPGVQGFLSFVFYHVLRILKGGVKIAIEQLKNS